MDLVAWYVLALNVQWKGIDVRVRTDPEDYAYEKFGQALHHILSGGLTEFRNTNYPKDHCFRKWTIDEVRNEIASGSSIEQALDGDWS